MSLTDQIFSAGIVGCGGAGFPTHVKYNAKPEHLIINAAECEPLLRTDRYVMCNYAPEIIAGCEAAMQHLGAKDCTIALKEPYVEEIAALQNVIDQKNSKVTLHTFPSFYPAGDEQVMVYEVTGKVVPPAAIPLEVGCVVSNVATILAIHDAAADKPFTHKFLTMTGEVANPTVLHVPIGTSFADCLAQAGGANIEDYFVINGGPMMGKPLTKEQALATTVTKTTSGYILLPKDSRLPSLLTTMKNTSSTFSYVVKRLPHFSHSLRRRMAWPSSVGLESMTFVSGASQNGHFIGILPTVQSVHKSSINTVPLYAISCGL